MTEATTAAAIIPNDLTGGRKPDIARYSGATTPMYSVTGRSHELTGLSGGTSTKHVSTATQHADNIVLMSNDAGAERQDLMVSIADTGNMLTAP